MAFSSGTFSRLFDWTTDRDAGVKIRADRFDQELDGFATGLTTTILKDGTQTTTAVVPFAFGISIVDNKAITLGTNSDITIQYDETTNDSLEIAAAIEGAALGIVFKSDQGDDNADQHKLSIADGGTLTLASKISGSFVTYLTHTPNSTVASSTLAVAGNLTVGGNLTLGSGAVLSEAELEQLDGITAGTVTASKAVVVDSNKDIASFRNITLTGELDAGSLDVSGDADIDGTLEADAITVGGTALNTVIAGVTVTNATTAAVATTVTISDNESTNEENAVVFTAGGDVDGGNIGLESDGDLTYNPSTGTVTATVFKGNIDAVDGDFDGTLEADAITIGGTGIGSIYSAIAGSSSIVTTGALNSGSITSGFGAIDNGSSNITTTGVGTFASLDISGDIDVDGTSNLDVVDIDGAVDMASTLAVSGNITLGGTSFINIDTSAQSTAFYTSNSFATQRDASIPQSVNTQGGQLLCAVDAGTCFFINRGRSDGTIADFRRSGTSQGSISISSTTTSYNAFTGSHWSRLTDNSKPTILRGTVMETIDEMCDWYALEFTIPEHDGEVAQDLHISYEKPSNVNVGDTVSYTHEGVAYDATVVLEGDIKHVKSKISDTADCTNVYGVFMDWDNDDDTVNDMYVNAVGTAVVRIHKDQTVAKGDLLTSNGDGTAKKQDDDIIRSKTIGKVLTNIKQETYSDSSYTVPCALYCG